MGEKSRCGDFKLRRCKRAKYHVINPTLLLFWNIISGRLAGYTWATTIVVRTTRRIFYATRKKSRPNFLKLLIHDKLLDGPQFNASSFKFLTQEELRKKFFWESVRGLTICWETISCKKKFIKIYDSRRLKSVRF